MCESGRLRKEPGVLVPVEVVSPERMCTCGTFTYRNPVVSVVYCPPSPKHLIERIVALVGIPALEPGLYGANEVDQVDAGLEVSVGRDVLVVGRGGDIVREADAVVAVAEVHVEQALVSAIEGDAPLGHGHESVVVAEVRGEDHDTSVEDVGPANVRGGGKRGGNVEELIGSSIGEDIGIDVDDLGELRLLPEVDLGECRVQVRTVHQLQIGGLLVSDARYGDDMVVHSLRLRKGA